MRASIAYMMRAVQPGWLNTATTAAESSSSGVIDTRNTRTTPPFLSAVRDPSVDASIHKEMAVTIPGSRRLRCKGFITASREEHNLNILPGSGDIALPQSRAPQRAVRGLLVALLTAVMSISGIWGVIPQTAQAKVEVTSATTPFPGLVQEHILTRLDNGDRVRGTITRFHPDDPYLELQPALSGGGVAGLETVPAIERRLSGSLAAVNGGFWMDPPDGGPTGRAHGVSMMDGMLDTGARTLWGNPGYRGTLGIQPTGGVVLSRLSSAITITRPDGAVVIIDEVNTLFLNTNGWDQQILLYTPRYPTTVNIPVGGTALVLEGASLRPNVGTPAVVSSRVDGGSTGVPVAIPPGGALVVSDPGAADRLDALEVGDTVTINVGIFALDGDPNAWSSVVDALPGGPYIVRGGARTRSDDWIAEGFSHERHNSPRASRTAIGIRANGEILLVTVDGRQPGWSAGMNMWEFANLMVDLGAAEALSLDGGGSTTATLFGQVVNRPSGGGPRGVANALVVRHTYPFDHSIQVGGRDRYDTAARVATTAFPDGATTVVLATGKDFPDALAGGPLAAGIDAPLLLTLPTELPATTIAALERLGTTRVLLLGGSVAVSQDVVTQLQNLGIQVSRISGQNRHATAEAIGDRLVGADRPDTVFLASGRGFADALVAAAPAGRLDSPILLTEPDALPTATVSFLKRLTPQRIVIVGGSKAVSSGVEAQVQELAPLTRVERLAGPDRYATATAIADWSIKELSVPAEVVVARGDAFPDALAGGPFTASRNALLMIIPPGNTLHADAASSAWLTTHAGPLETVSVLGGSSVVSLYERVRLDRLISK